MPQTKRARAATGSSEASLRESKKRNRPRKSLRVVETDDDEMIGVENTPTPKPTPKGGVRPVKEKDSSSSEEKDSSDSKEKDESESDDDSDSPGGLLDCLKDIKVEKTTPKGRIASPSEGPPSSDEMDEYVELTESNKKSAKSKSKGGDEAEKSYVLPDRKDKGKAKAVKKPDPDDRTTGSSMHAPNNNPVEVAKATTKKPIASTSRTPAAAGSSRLPSKPSYSQVVMSPPKKMDLAAIILARKNIAVPKEPEISSEQPWRRARTVPNDVVHFDYQAPYRYMREKPADEILDKPRLVWAIPYAAYQLSEECLRTVLEATKFLAPEATPPEVVFQTKSGFYLLQVQTKQVVETLLEARVALNYRRHRAVFFYENYRAPRVKYVVVASSVTVKDMQSLEEALGASVEKLLVQKLAKQPCFTEWTPKLTSKTFDTGKWREIRRYRVVLDFAAGIKQKETQDKAVDALWAWDRMWTSDNVAGLVIELDDDPSGTKFRFLLHPLCALCHSDAHWKDHCEWAKTYPVLKPWSETKESEGMEED